MDNAKDQEKELPIFFLRVMGAGVFDFPTKHLQFEMALLDFQFVHLLFKVKRCLAVLEFHVFEPRFQIGLVLIAERR